MFLGTPADAVPSLRALVDAGFDVPLVVSGPDRRRGRRGTPTPTPVKAAALDLGLRVSTEVSDALDVDADLGVVVAFGHLIRRPVLEQLPMLNVHFSLLPRWRGAAPVERALLAGDDRTGVCVMGLEVGLDTGPVYSRAETPIGATDTAAALRTRLADMGASLLIESLTSGLGVPEPQTGESTHAAKLDTSDREIDWTASSAEIDRLVRIGGAWTTLGNGRFKIHDVALVDASDGHAADADPIAGQLRGLDVTTGDATLRLVTVQAEGKPRQPADAWAHGARLGSGVVLGVASATDTTVAST